MRRTKLLAIALSLIATGAFSLNSMHAIAAPTAEQIFGAKCAVCHAADGSGNTNMGKKLKVRDLRSAEVQKQTDAQLTEIIGRGKNKMPAYEPTLGKDSVVQLVGYTRVLAKK